MVLHGRDKVKELSRDTAEAKMRFATGNCNSHQAAVAAALELFTPCLPSLYYGTEQGLASGVEPENVRFVCAQWGREDGREQRQQEDRCDAHHAEHASTAFGQ